MSHDPMKKCCRSMPSCRRCPLRLAAAQAHEQRKVVAALVEEILRGNPFTFPDSVNDALLSLSLARRQRSMPRAR